MQSVGEAMGNKVKSKRPGEKYILCSLSKIYLYIKIDISLEYKNGNSQFRNYEWLNTLQNISNL